MEDEGVLFEGLRLGSRRAFTGLLVDDDATMHRVAALYVGPDRVDALVRQTWSVALPGLDMFTWQTSLRTWLTGILVTYGRAWAAGSTWPGPVALPPPRGDRPEGPVPWSSLAWSAWWDDDGWDVLERALAAQPLDRREVLWLHDVEGWAWREVLDTLGHPAAEGGHLLADGRAAIGAGLERHLGVAPADDPADRDAGVARLLGGLRPRAGAAGHDPGLDRVFADWRRGRGGRPWRRWGWELRRRRSAGRAAPSPDDVVVGRSRGS